MSCKFKNNNNHHFGFTLAEILITLGVIGVVAALTIPTLIEKHFEKMAVSKFKQTYSILDNAVRLMMEQEGCVGPDCFKNIERPDIETIAGNIDRNFKYLEKVCTKYGQAKKEIKWLPEYGYGLDGSQTSFSTLVPNWKVGAENSNVCFYKMNNGSTVAISRMCAFSNSGIVNFAIDVNGKQGPNRVGKDNFPVATSNLNIVGLEPFYKVHIWGSPTCWLGLCQGNGYFKNCPPSATNPAAYILYKDKLPNLTEAGFPAKP